MAIVLTIEGNAKSREKKQDSVFAAPKMPLGRFQGGWNATIVLEKVMVRELDQESEEMRMSPQFLADLKRVSAKVEPGQKLTRDEGIKRILTGYADVIDALGG